MLRYRLYLGRDINGVAEVHEDDWKRFCQQVLDDQLDEYTVYEAEGVWKGNHERTYIVEVLSNMADARVAVKYAGNRYKQWFEQDAVYLTVDEVESELL